MKPYWRYRIWNAWHNLGYWCEWLAIPYRTVSTRLWDWCHYQHGHGAHLNLRKRSWLEIWRREVGKHRDGEE